MPRISYLKGHISLPFQDLPLFKLTKLYRSIDQETKAGETEPIQYDRIGQTIHILFSDTSLQNIEEIIVPDLIVFFDKFKPGTLSINLIHWMALEDFNVTNYYTDINFDLISQTLSEAPLKTLVAHPEIEVTSL